MFLGNLPRKAQSTSSANTTAVTNSIRFATRMSLPGSIIIPPLYSRINSAVQAEPIAIFGT
jgi:hypothetical protein